MAFLLENQMPLTSLEPSRQKLVLSVIEEYHGPIVAVSVCTYQVPSESVYNVIVVL